VMIADQLRSTASGLYRHSDNIPLGRDGSGTDRVAELREVADELVELAGRLEQAAVSAR
jgi:hypothetical protein